MFENERCWNFSNEDTISLMHLRYEHDIIML